MRLKKEIVKEKGLDYCVWLVCLLLFLVAGGIFLLDWFTPLSVASLRYSCWINRMSHLYCPGCGGTRAFFAWIHGHWLTSLYYHPVVGYFGILYFLFFLRGFLAYGMPGRFSYMRFRLGYVYVGIAIILLQFLIKNASLLLFGYLWM